MAHGIGHYNGVGRISWVAFHARLTRAIGVRDAQGERTLVARGNNNGSVVPDTDRIAFADVCAEVTARRFNEDRTFADCKAPAIRLYLVSWGKHPAATWMVWCDQL
jgi:hypothetical protein